MSTRRPVLRALAAALALAACGAPPPPPPVAPPPPPHRIAVAPTPPPSLRLPELAHPERYLLDLALDPSKDSFSGVVTIDLVIDKATSVIWLNATDLTIESASLALGERTLSATPVPAGKDFIGLSFTENLPPGKAVLTISYKALVDHEHSRGVYAQREGMDDDYAYTIFEPIDARRAFPCFDEPGYKVPWNITLRVKKNHIALANTPIRSDTLSPDGTRVLSFAQTKPLPSYLVAFIVGPFELVDAGTAGRNKIPLRFAVPRGRGAETRYAKEVTPRIVALLEDYFGMPYPYEKLDVAVVPRFRGTMEHPGIVALGQPLTLIKPDEETLERKKEYANIATHELAHYWFGDYVTMRWWDDTWLNEGLAEWLDEKITDSLEPSWQFPLERLQMTSHSMNADALASARKVRNPVESRHDIEGSFDGAITYGKGAAVMGMFERWLGKETFQKGIRRHMAQNAWKNATADDFFAALSAEAGRELSTPMKSFLEQPGVPLVSAELSCKTTPPNLSLSQRRFVPIGSKVASEGLWQIPVCVKYDAGKKSERACTLLTEARATLPLASASACPSWVLLNEDARGYYRSSYDPATLSLLLGKAKEKLSPAERTMLVSDIGALVRAGAMPLGDALSLVPAMVKDGDPALLQSSFDIVGAVRKDTLPDDLKASYTAFIRKTYGPKARALGFSPKPGERELEQAQRARLLGIVALAGEDEALQKEALTLALRFLDDRKAIHPSVVEIVLVAAAKRKDRVYFDKLIAAVKAAKDRSERQPFLWALGHFDDPGLVKEAFGLLAQIEPRDAQPLLGGALFSPKTREMTYAFIKERFDALFAKLQGDGGAMLLMPAGIFCDEAHRADAAAFFSKYADKIDNGPRVLATQLERVDLCIAQARESRPSLEAFLKKKGKLR